MPKLVSSHWSNSIEKTQSCHGQHMPRGSGIPSPVADNSVLVGPGFRKLGGDGMDGACSHSKSPCDVGTGTSITEVWVGLALLQKLVVK